MRGPGNHDRDRLLDVHRLLQEFPRITRPDGCPVATQHDTMHHIINAPGPLVAKKPRRFAPDRLAAAKKQFEEMLRLSLARPGEGPWASPLHMVPKQGGRVEALR